MCTANRSPITAQVLEAKLPYDHSMSVCWTVARSVGLRVGLSVTISKSAEVTLPCVYWCASYCKYLRLAPKQLSKERPTSRIDDDRLQEVTGVS